MSSVRFPYSKELDGEQWIDRYPEWCHGGKEWHRQSFENGRWIRPRLPLLEENASPSQRVSKQNPKLRPRVFISHRQGDIKYAERIAYLADQAGFYFWLDAVNLPPPPVIANWTAVSIALRIELALLNCSHIVAVYTDITPGSTWVPYEYGRVKEPVLQATECCTWLYVQNVNTIVPEWVELNEKCTTEKGLRQWFKNEYGKWGGSFPQQPLGIWKGATTPLP